MTIRTDRPGRLEWAALALILLLAAGLRLGAPGISEFKLDEARLSLLALDMARGQSFPLLGIGSSVGIPNMPVNVWLFALPFLFTSDPTAATLFVGRRSATNVFDPQASCRGSMAAKMSLS